MIFISHRGNVNGRVPELENKPSNILKVIEKHLIEIDIWNIEGRIYLGHDNPEYLIDLKFIEQIKPKTFFHAKNLNIIKILNNLNCRWFLHDKDSFTFVQNVEKKMIWGFPEIINFIPKDFDVCIVSNNNHVDFNGYVCSDYLK